MRPVSCVVINGCRGGTDGRDGVPSLRVTGWAGRRSATVELPRLEAETEVSLGYTGQRAPTPPTRPRFPGIRDRSVPKRTLRSTSARRSDLLGRGRTRLGPAFSAGCVVGITLIPHTVRTEGGNLHLATRLALDHDAIAKPCGSLNTPSELPVTLRGRSYPHSREGPSGFLSGNPARRSSAAPPLSRWCQRGVEATFKEPSRPVSRGRKPLQPHRVAIRSDHSCDCGPERFPTTSGRMPRHRPNMREGPPDPTVRIRRPLECLRRFAAPRISGRRGLAGAAPPAVRRLSGS